MIPADSFPTISPWGRPLGTRLNHRSGPSCKGRWELVRAGRVGDCLAGIGEAGDREERWN
ncbi:MAG: hypothetical protein JJLCMIEE_03551 [Acidimicrobiales bacterium]|nr:MAG: hypothetical protein EDR02_18035 [Actinomycetota bacterium]MBV6510411.1 hypothetical protein [Acidimicrobiales bacterium]